MHGKKPSLSILEVEQVTQAMIHSKIEATILELVPKHVQIWQPKPA